MAKNIHLKFTITIKRLLRISKKEITSVYDEITKRATSKISEIKSAQDGLETKLKNYADLFQKVSIKDKEGITEFYRLGDMEKANEQLEEYRTLLIAVKDRGADARIFDMLETLTSQKRLKSQNY